MYLFLRICRLITKVQICDMPHFKAFGMRNLQYEIETCHKIYNNGTVCPLLIQVTIFLSGTDITRIYLDRMLFRPIINSRSSFSYFSTVIQVKFSFANPTTGVNFRPFFAWYLIDQASSWANFKKELKRGSSQSDACNWSCFLERLIF